MRSLLLLFGCITMALLPPPLAAAAQNPRPDEIVETCGDMTFSFTKSNGARITVFGYPIIQDSVLFVVKPRFEDRYYGALDHPEFEKSITIEPYRDGKRITIRHYNFHRAESLFQGRESYTLLPDNTCSVTLEYSFRGKESAWIEWKIAGLNAVALAGRSFTAISDSATTAGTFPLRAVASHPKDCMIARGLKTIRIASALGPLEIQTDPRNDVVLFDYRKNTWAPANRPQFWLGLFDHPIPAESSDSVSVLFRFPKQAPKPAEAKPRPVVPIPLDPVEKSVVPSWEYPTIIPKPKSLELLPEGFRLNSGVKIIVGKNPGPGIENAIAFLQKDLKDLYDLALPVVREAPPAGELPAGCILLGEAERFPLPAGVCEQAGAGLPEHDEGYSLLVTKDRVCVAAQTERGVFYGITTLLQLAKVSEAGLEFKGARITDYPSLDFRGIHCLSGKNAGDEISKALRTLMARFKINTLVWQCEYIVWDSCPELEHREYGMTKSDARKVIEAAPKHFVEIIPLVQSLGHSEWIFTNGHNLHFAEDPEHPYAYSPIHPDSYKFIFKVYQEVLDFFQPRIFHIGHDEVTTEGRFPHRSKDSGKTVTELIMEDTLKLHRWFTERKVQVMLWGDMFLYRTEGPDACLAPTLEDARLRRAQLPRDVFVADWHYGIFEPEELSTLPLWKNEGFPVVGCPWFRAENIRNMALACIQNGVEGLLQTTWAGFNFRITDNPDAWHQYWAYIWAAHYAWSGDTTPPEQLPFEAKDVFLDLWFERKPLLGARDGFAVDLRPLCNRRLADDERRAGWVGLGPESDLSAFPAAQDRLDDVRFRVRPNERGEAAVLLAGRFNPEGTFPSAVEIPLGDARLFEAHFLMTAAFQTAEGTRVGEAVFTYRDGARERLALIYGINIFSYDDVRSGPDARTAWQGMDRSGRPIGVLDVTWRNPLPDKPLASVVIESAQTEAAPILLALTGVHP